MHLLSGMHASVGAGTYRLASVGGYVWHDVNANGRWDRTAVEIEEAALHGMEGILSVWAGASQPFKKQVFW